MNDQRIQELAKQATIRINSPTVNSNGKVICDNWEEGISISKFAELIIRDCQTLMINNIENQLTEDGIVLAFREHFGIE